MFGEYCCDGPQKALVTIFTLDVFLETVSALGLLLYREAVGKRQFCTSTSRNRRRKTVSKPLSSQKWIFKRVTLLDLKR